MGNDAVESGWERFLERLKQLWGKLRDDDLTTAAASMAAEQPSH
ncbi:MAG: hypothetical protein WBE92_03215 [Steroidobacteraceae bacterium]